MIAVGNDPRAVIDTHERAGPAVDGSVAVVTFDLEPVTLAARTEWFHHYAPTGRHRLLVSYDGPTLLGYASTSPFAVKAAYETSVEVSVYLAPDGVGHFAPLGIFDVHP